jgi:molybdopterin-binding protein
MDKQGRLKRSEAAAALGVTSKTLYMWERSGKIPPPERDWRGWRWYTQREIGRIRQELLGDQESEKPVLPLSIDVSARNRLPGTIKAINMDSVLTEVVLQLENGDEIAAIITRTAAKRLGLKVGQRAIAFVEATEVMIGR